MTSGPGQGLRFRSGVSNPEYCSGENELPVQEALRESLHSGDTFYDIGANVGFFTVIGAHLVGPDGVVMAFEPVPANADMARRNARLNRFKQIVVVERAVSDTAGGGELQIAAYSGGSALTTVPPPPDATGAIQTVELVTIDDAVFQQGMRPPHVVKVDVEGAEFQVLTGMRRTMAEVRPTIILELDDASVDELAKKEAACRGLLSAAGYAITSLPNSYESGHWLVKHLVARRGSDDLP
jgi:FkbM family methyltransferase